MTGRLKKKSHFLFPWVKNKHTKGKEWQRMGSELSTPDMTTRITLQVSCQILILLNHKVAWCRLGCWSGTDHTIGLSKRHWLKSTQRWLKPTWFLLRGCEDCLNWWWMDGQGLAGSFERSSLSSIPQTSPMPPVSQGWSDGARKYRELQGSKIPNMQPRLEARGIRGLAGEESAKEKGRRTNTWQNQ